MNYGGWDHHQSSSTPTRGPCEEHGPRCGGPDPGSRRARSLDSTLVVLLGEFGRTPKVNGRTPVATTGRRDVSS